MNLRPVLALAALCALHAWAAAQTAPAAAQAAPPAPAAAQTAAVVVGDFSLGVGANGVPPPWSLVTRYGKPDLREAPDGGLAALFLRSSNTSFGLERRVAVDLAAFPFLSWKWRVDELPVNADFRSGERGDEAAQVYVAFSPTRILGYVWDTSAPEMTVGDAQRLPPFVKVRIIVLRSGKKDAGTWQTEERDILADYRLAFGGETPPSKAAGFRLHINSQHTASSAAAAFADIAFKAAR